jgi:hypothetical protein
MRFSLTSLIRTLAVIFLGSSAAAIGLARLAPPPKPWRMPCRVANVNVNIFLLNHGSRDSLWLAKDEGRTSKLPIPSGSIFDYASCSPWRDDRGRSQVVGRWSRDPSAFQGENDFGLARLSYPDGELIDRISTDVVPVSPPCWYPGTGTRVLFAAGDGRLYQYEFESHSGTTSDPDGDRQNEPTPLVWDCKAPGTGDVYISDPHWSTDTHSNRIVVVALRLIEPNTGRQQYTRSQLWWLRLSEDGHSIKEAGRLVQPPTGVNDVEERSPSIGRTSDGRLALAYLRKTGFKPWELRMTPLDLDATGVRPLTLTSVGSRIAEGCQPFSPIISSDGRCISYIQGDTPHVAIIRRVLLEGGSGGSPALGAISLSAL